VRANRTIDLASGRFSRAIRPLWLLLSIVIASGVILALPRTPQDPAYHRFADGREFCGVSNSLNVLSNLPFLIVGVLGLFHLVRSAESDSAQRAERCAYSMMFAGLMLIGLGSAYYHLSPGNDRLVWDRLPMTIVFMSLVSAMISERISARAGQLLLGPLLLCGVGSVLYWEFTERAGIGDVRPYAVVQYYSLIFVVVLTSLYRSRYNRSADLITAAGLYIGAKLCETFDSAIFSAGHIVSGHTLKHLLAAASAYWILRMLKKRSLRLQTY